MRYILMSLLSVAAVANAASGQVVSYQMTDDTYLDKFRPTEPMGDFRLLLGMKIDLPGFGLNAVPYLRPETPGMGNVVSACFVLPLTNQMHSDPLPAIEASRVVGWNWDEGTATWANKAGGHAETVNGVLTIYGDANLDGRVDTGDLNVLAQHLFSYGTWEQGDFNGDGAVDGSDFNIWNDNRFDEIGVDGRKADVLYVNAKQWIGDWQTGTNHGIRIEVIDDGEFVAASKESTTSWPPLLFVEFE